MTRLPVYLAAAGLARLADEMVATTVVLLVLDRTGDPALAGLCVAGYTVPSVLSGPLLGALLDRARRRADLLVASGASLAAACTGLAFAVGHAPAALAPALMVLAGVAVPLTSGGYSSLLVALVPAERRAAANSADATSFSVAAIAGPGLAGLLAATAGTGTGVLVVAVVAAAGALATVALRAHHGEPEPHRSTTAAIRAGFGHLVHTRALLGPTLTTVLGFGAVGVLSVALPLWTAELGAGTTAAGYLLTALEAGSLVVTLTAARRLRPDRAGRTVLVSTALFGVLLSGWLLARSLPVALAVAVAAGLAEGLTLPAIFAVRQTHTPARLLGQVSVTGASLKIGGYALGALLGSVLVPAVGPRGALAVVALAQLVAAGLGWAVSAGAADRGTP